MTAEIGSGLDDVLKAPGVPVFGEGTHSCMPTRGVGKSDASMVTSRMLGVFRDRPESRQEVLCAIGGRAADPTGNIRRGAGD